MASLLRRTTLADERRALRAQSQQHTASRVHEATYDSSSDEEDPEPFHQKNNADDADDDNAGIAELKDQSQQDSKQEQGDLVKQYEEKLKKKPRRTRPTLTAPILVDPDTGLGRLLHQQPKLGGKPHSVSACAAYSRKLFAHYHAAVREWNGQAPHNDTTWMNQLEKLSSQKVVREHVETLRQVVCRQFVERRVGLEKADQWWEQLARETAQVYQPEMPEERMEAPPSPTTTTTTSPPSHPEEMAAAQVSPPTRPVPDGTQEEDDDDETMPSPSSPSEFELGQKRPMSQAAAQPPVSKRRVVADDDDSDEELEFETTAKDAPSDHLVSKRRVLDDDDDEEEAELEFESAPSKNNSTESFSVGAPEEEETKDSVSMEVEETENIKETTENTTAQVGDSLAALPAPNAMTIDQEHENVQETLLEESGTSELNSSDAPASPGRLVVLGESTQPTSPNFGSRLGQDTQPFDTQPSPEDKLFDTATQESFHEGFDAHEVGSTPPSALETMTTTHNEVLPQHDAEIETLQSDSPAKEDNSAGAEESFRAESEPDISIVPVRQEMVIETNSSSDDEATVIPTMSETQATLIPTATEDMPTQLEDESQT